MTLLGGLKDYIPEQNKLEIELAICNLKEEFEYDPAAISQLQLALLLFQDAVNHVLRNHNIKPHWMFALDNLVRSAVQAAITVMSPELGENLAAGNDPRLSRDSGRMGMEADATDVYTPGTIVDSFPGLQRIPSIVIDTDLEHEQAEEVKKEYRRVKSENGRLWNELLSQERQLQEMLKSKISGLRASIHALESQRSHSSHNVSGGDVSVSVSLPTTPRIIVGNDINPFSLADGGDVGLIAWLTDRRFDADTIRKVPVF